MTAAAPLGGPVKPTGSPRFGKAKALAIDLAERVGSTFAEAFLAALFATVSVQGVVQPSHQVDWVTAAAIGLMAAAVAFLSTLLLWMVKTKPITNRYLDLLYRVAMTFAQTLLGYLTAAGAVSAFSFNWNAALLASLTAAGQAALKGIIGVTNPRTAGAAVFVPRSPAA